MDADGNGTVDFEEFLRFVGNKFEQTRTVRVDSVDQSAQQPADPVEDEANKLVFNMFDKEETDLILLSSPGFLEVSATTDKVINLDEIKTSMEKNEQESYLTIGTTPVISIKPTKGNSGL